MLLPRLLPRHPVAVLRPEGLPDHRRVRVLPEGHANAGCAGANVHVSVDAPKGPKTKTFPTSLPSPIEQRDWGSNPREEWAGKCECAVE